jgi:hypothetical protein
MFTTARLRPFNFNQNIYNYWVSSTNDSLKKIKEHYEKERKLKGINMNLALGNIPNNNSFPHNSSTHLIIVSGLSISSFLYYLYKCKK